MEWFLKDYKEVKNKYPNIYREVNKHKHFYQVGSSYGDLSKMFKTPEEATEYARRKNRTKKFTISKYKW